MTVSLNKKEFLVEQVPEFLKQLTPESEANFGLMTPQHMVEHVIMTTKATSRRRGEAPDEPTKSHQGFLRFIESGAKFEYRPSSKTKDDLNPLKYGSLEEAISHVKPSLEAFYTAFESDPSFKCYNDFIGELSFEQAELLGYQHFKWHLYQFGILDSFEV